MSRCLVTGHKGYIGSKLFTKLDDGNNIVHGIDLNHKVKWIENSVRKGDIKYSHSCISELLSIG